MKDPHKDSEERLHQIEKAITDIERFEKKKHYIPFAVRNLLKMLY